MNGKRVSFSPYMVGGNGHEYTEEEIEIMEYLIDNGSHVGVNDVCSKYGATPLHMAYIHDNEKFIQFLIQHGADQNATGDYGNCAGKIPSDFGKASINTPIHNAGN